MKELAVYKSLNTLSKFTQRIEQFVSGGQEAGDVGGVYVQGGGGLCR